MANFSQVGINNEGHYVQEDQKDPNGQLSSAED